MEIITEQTKEAAKIRAGRILQDLLKKRRTPEGVDYDVLFLSSGGSSLDLLSSIDPAILDSFYTITMLDERYSIDEHVNNFAQLSRTSFYRNATLRKVHWIDTRVGPGEDMEEFEERFENALREWRRDNPQGKVIATFGMGEDGHVAGIMPYPENPQKFSFLFENSSQWVISYDVTKEKNAFPLRVTTTFPFFKHVVNYAVGYITGEAKKSAFERLLAPHGTLAQTPIRILRELRHATIVTDIHTSTIPQLSQTQLS